MLMMMFPSKHTRTQRNQSFCIYKKGEERGVERRICWDLEKKGGSVCMCICVYVCVCRVLFV